MDLSQFLRLLDDNLPNQPPVWDPTDRDQEGQFNAWKDWSSKWRLREQVRQMLEDESHEAGLRAGHS